MTCTEHDFGSDGCCRNCEHWDPEHYTDPVHLWTGILVCGKPKSWCGAEAVVVGNKVRNMTDAAERSTCEACTKAEQEVRAKYAK